jgi:hypothetical protein
MTIKGATRTPSRSSNRKDQLLRLTEFTDAGEAASARRATEDEFQNTAIQVVMFAARSLDSIKRTHPHYFGQQSAGDSLEFAALA